VRPHPPPWMASTRPEAQSAIHLNYHYLYRGERPIPSQPGVVLPIPTIGDVGGGEAEEKEAGSCPRERYPPRRPEPPVRRSQTADAAHTYIPCFLCSVSSSSSESMTPLCPFSPTPTRQPVATEVRACSPAHLLRSRPSSRGENTMSIVVAAAAVHAVV
jgi:hypothetical protein